MRTHLTLTLTRTFLLVALSLSASAKENRSSTLPRSAPEAQGVSSEGVLAFVDAADRELDALHGFLLLRHGHVVAEGGWAPYDPASNHELYSLSKSFTSTAVGLAVSEGRLSLDDEVLKFFPEDAPSDPSANLKAMRVRDLLCMSAGHQDEISSAADKVSAKAFLAHAVPHKPGTHFKYNTPATFMLSAIVQKQTGETVLDYLRPRLFEPLGILNPVWNTNFQGISLGGYGLRVRTEDIARFGQLYLQKGRWQGRQLIPAGWIEMATARQVSNGSNPNSDWDQGYGFQFWRSRHDAYRGDGAFGQFCIVLPRLDAVIAITSGLKDMQAVLNLVWDKLLPALETRRLPSDATHRKALEARLASLSLPTARGSASSSLAGQVLGRKFTFPTAELPAETLTLTPASTSDAGGRGVVLVTNARAVESRIPCGYGEWQKGRAAFGSYADEPIAASGAWVAEDTFEAKVYAIETPYCATIRLKFSGNQVTRDTVVNVGFGPTAQPQQVGQAQ